MIGKILVGFDGSESAKRAFAWAHDLAEKLGAELHVLAVSRPPEFGTEVETKAIMEKSREHYAHVLHELKEGQESGALPMKLEMAVGHPAEKIVLYAEKAGIDLIVVGHRGRSLFERLLLGSVARQVVAHAHCAVTVVRD
jgi:nucleotide-binding universal stress UspA family protein